MIFTTQCTLVHMRGLGIACRPSVCPSVCLGRLDYLSQAKAHTNTHTHTHTQKTTTIYNKRNKKEAVEKSTYTLLSHITCKCEHHNLLQMATIDRNARWVIALTTA